ncbi:WYL domain-containing protein [Paenibacillus sp. JX-17]|uniref:WYL domain-containing protein n=1 Tax=Paenibacillus lacisoli TaxID=3064525 RepID=A0ABT9CED1_9BACL|nr:WYL domain-containing protein [Paenibacillus sp. JX-17]MDO7907620.1 WYL domain-containing protein [Paenibacillus sp. JX-17]
MNPFEKIFNYQIMSRLDDSGTFVVTSHERAWLKTMLRHPAAKEALTGSTRKKLAAILEPDDVIDTAEHITEKARSAERQIYHPLLRTLRSCIHEGCGITLSYSIKNGREFQEQSGLAYKLEYSMIKREWYLLWYHLKHRAFMSTRLNHIRSLERYPLKPDYVERIRQHLERTLQTRRRKTLVQIMPEYNKELSRILYAFSCFEKDVTYDADRKTYTVTVCYMGDEAEYLLSKIRFLGKRVRVIEGDYLRSRMLEASTKALGRYGAGPVSELPADEETGKRALPLDLAENL